MQSPSSNEDALSLILTPIVLLWMAAYAMDTKQEGGQTPAASTWHIGYLPPCQGTGAPDMPYFICLGEVTAGNRLTLQPKSWKGKDIESDWQVHAAQCGEVKMGPLSAVHADVPVAISSIPAWNCSIYLISSDILPALDGIVESEIIGLQPSHSSTHAQFRDNWGLQNTMKWCAERCSMLSVLAVARIVHDCIRVNCAAWGIPLTQTSNANVHSTQTAALAALSHYLQHSSVLQKPNEHRLKELNIEFSSHIQEVYGYNPPVSQEPRMSQQTMFLPQQPMQGSHDSGCDPISNMFNPRCQWPVPEGDWNPVKQWELHQMATWSPDRTKYLNHGCFRMACPAGTATGAALNNTILMPWFQQGHHKAIQVQVPSSIAHQEHGPMQMDFFYSKTTGASVAGAIVGQCDGKFWAVQTLDSTGAVKPCVKVPHKELITAMQWQFHAKILFECTPEFPHGIASNLRPDHIASVLHFSWCYQGHLLAQSAMNQFDVAQVQLHDFCPCNQNGMADCINGSKFHVGDFVLKNIGSRIPNLNQLKATHVVIGITKDDTPLLYPLAQFATSTNSRSITPPEAPSTMADKNTWTLKSSVLDIFPPDQFLPKCNTEVSSSSDHFVQVKNLYDTLRNSTQDTEQVLAAIQESIHFDIDNFETGHHGKDSHRGSHTEWCKGNDRGTLAAHEIRKILEVIPANTWHLGTKSTVMYWNKIKGKTHLASTELLSIYFAEPKGTSNFRDRFTKFLAYNSSTGSIFVSTTIATAKAQRLKHNQSWQPDHPVCSQEAAPRFLGTSKQNKMSHTILEGFFGQEAQQTDNETSFHIVWRMKRTEMVSTYSRVYLIWCKAQGVKAQVDCAITFKQQDTSEGIDIPLSRRRAHRNDETPAQATADITSAANINKLWSCPTEHTVSAIRLFKADAIAEEKWIPFKAAQLRCPLFIPHHAATPIANGRRQRMLPTMAHKSPAIGIGNNFSMDSDGSHGAAPSAGEATEETGTGGSGDSPTYAMPPSESDRSTTVPHEGSSRPDSEEGGIEPGKQAHSNGGKRSGGDIQAANHGITSSFDLELLGGNYRICSTKLKRWGISQVKSYCSLYHLMQSWVMSNNFSIRPIDYFLPPATNAAIVSNVILVTQGVYAFLNGDPCLPDMEEPREAASFLRVEATIESRPFDLYPPSLRLLVMRTCLSAMYFFSKYESILLPREDITSAILHLEQRCKEAGFHTKLLPCEERFESTVNGPMSASPLQQGIFMYALNCAGFTDKRNPITAGKISSRQRNKEANGECHSFVLGVEAAEHGHAKLQLNILSNEHPKKEFDATRNLVRQLASRIPQDKTSQTLLAIAVLEETQNITEQDVKDGKTLVLRRSGVKGNYASTIKVISTEQAPVHTPLALPPHLPGISEAEPGEPEATTQADQQHRGPSWGCTICAGAPGHGLWTGPLLTVPYCEQCAEQIKSKYSSRNRWILQRLSQQQLHEAMLQCCIAACLGKQEGMASAGGIELGTHRSRSNPIAASPESVLIAGVHVLDGLLEHCHYGGSHWPLPHMGSGTDAEWVQQLAGEVQQVTLLGRLQTMAIYACRAVSLELSIAIAERWEGVVASEQKLISMMCDVSCGSRLEMETPGEAHGLCIGGTVLPFELGVGINKYQVVLDNGSHMWLKEEVIVAGINQYEEHIRLDLKGCLVAVQPIPERLGSRWADLLYLKDVATSSAPHGCIHPSPNSKWIETGPKILGQQNPTVLTCGELFSCIIGKIHKPLESLAKITDCLTVLKEKMNTGLGSAGAHPLEEPRIGCILCWAPVPDATTTQPSKRRKRRKRRTSQRDRRPAKHQPDAATDAGSASKMTPQFCPSLWVVVAQEDNQIMGLGRSTWSVAPLHGINSEGLKKMNGAHLLSCIQQFEALCTDANLDTPTCHPSHPAHLLKIARHGHLSLEEVQKIIKECSHGQELAAISLLEAGRVVSKPRKGVIQMVHSQLTRLGLDTAAGLPSKAEVLMVLARYGACPNPVAKIIAAMFSPDLIKQMSAGECVLVQAYIHMKDIDWRGMPRVVGSLKGRLHELLKYEPDGAAAHTLGAAAIRVRLVGEYFQSEKPSPSPQATDFSKPVGEAAEKVDNDGLRQALEDALKAMEEQDIEHLTQLRGTRRAAAIDQVSLSDALAWRWREAHFCEETEPDKALIQQLSIAITKLNEAANIESCDYRITLPGSFWLKGIWQGYTSFSTAELEAALREPGAAGMAQNLLAFEIITMRWERPSHITVLIKAVKKSRKNKKKKSCRETIFQTVRRAIIKAEEVGGWVECLKIRCRDLFSEWVKRQIQIALPNYLSWRYTCSWCHQGIWGRGVPYGRTYYFCESRSAGVACECTYLCKDCFDLQKYENFHSHNQAGHTMQECNGFHSSDASNQSTRTRRKHTTNSPTQASQTQHTAVDSAEESPEITEAAVGPDTASGTHGPADNASNRTEPSDVNKHKLGCLYYI